MQNELDAFNQERDVVHMVANARILENKLEQLEQRVAENEMNSQNLQAHNSGSVPHKKKRKEVVQNSNQVVGYPMVEKDSNIMKSLAQNSKSFGKTQEKGQSKLAVKNPNKVDGSLSQILDNIEKKGQYKEEVKSINEIIDKEIQSVKSDFNYENISIHNQKQGFEGVKSENKIVEPKKVWDTNG